MQYRQAAAVMLGVTAVNAQAGTDRIPLIPRPLACLFYPSMLGFRIV
jgi:hypothetical protein